MPAWKRMVRKRLKKRTRGRCFYCDKRLDTNWTIDHLIPISRGGTSRKSNLAPSCRRCNEEKGNMTHIEYFQGLS